MKKTAILGCAFILFALVRSGAQDNKWDPKKNPTVDSITAPYKLLEMPKPMTMEQAFPVIGQYQLTNITDKTEVGAVRIMLDEQKKGIVWIEGLPYGKIQAQLRRSPATYKIPAQKTIDGKDVPEGTLIYDKDTRMLSVCIGKPYNMQNPDLAFAAEETQPADVSKEAPKATAKAGKKTPAAPVQKVVMFSGEKEIQTTVMTNQ